ncbi:MAG: YcxB family protein [Bacilli bacterium]
MKEIKNTTVYSSDKIKKFLEIYYFERIKTIRIILNILIIMMIIYFFTKQDINTLDVITFIFALFGILEINTNMLPKLNYRRITKQKDSVIDTKLEYTFKKNNFKLVSNKEEYIDYNTLKKVIETNDTYYLYVNNSRALIVDKTALTKEENNKLSKIFQEKVSTYKYKK